MSSLTQLKSKSFSQLNKLYPENEIKNFMYMIFEHILGYSKIDCIIKENEIIVENKIKEIDNIIIRLQKHEPIQYILGEADFLGFKFKVNQHVLIPRAETEELVYSVMGSTIAHLKEDKLKIMDIGTGSGCITITLQKLLPQFNYFAVDVSKEAIDVATQNAIFNQAHTNSITFILADILNESNWSLLPYVDIIVSNPPYITEKEKKEMDKNVVDYEPHLALFIPDDNPLLFYDAIAKLAKQKLSIGGELYFEIH